MTTHNPYTPPGAPVTDLAAPPMAMPWQVNVAVWLIWVSLATEVVGYAIEPASLGFGIGTERDEVVSTFLVVLLVMVGLTLGLFVLLAFCIRRAQRWARIVYSVFVVIGLLSVFRGVPTGFERSWYYGALHLVTTAMDIATVVLLFTPAANTWFRKRRVAAQS